MKYNYLKHLFTVLLLMYATVATAKEFEVDAICYYITDDTNNAVEVTGGDYTGKSGYS